MVKEIVDYIRNHNALIVFDYDGTLKDLVPGASLEDPMDETLVNHLNTLAGRYSVAINTGRNIEQIYDLLQGATNIQYFFGNHGVIEFDAHQKLRNVLISSLDEAEKVVKDFHRRIHQQVEKYQSILEPRKYSYSFHVIPGESEGNKIAEEAMRSLCEEYPGFEILKGKTHIEFRPKELHKGQAIKRIAHHFPGKKMIYFGDDQTDLDAFREIRAFQGRCVSVGSIIRDQADHHLDTVDHVWELVHQLLAD